MTLAIHDLTEQPDTVGDWLRRVEKLHRQLRPGIGDYTALIRTMFHEGARMAVRHDGGVPKALALYRVQTSTFQGLRLYVDDLVTDEMERSAGHGGAMLDWCEAYARAQGCVTLALDSGVQRGAAHRFYFRRGMAIGSFGFARGL